MPPHAGVDRRTFLSMTAGAVAVSATRQSARAAAEGAPADRPRPCLFSKPLHNRPFRDLPPLLNQLGIDAVDLTCRKAGHVLPERVAEDLPAACELLKQAGIDVPMITTEITDTSDPHAEAVIRTIGKLGIRHIKLGYYEYGDLTKIEPRLAEVKGQMERVARLCKRHGVQAGFHNHCGPRVGGPLWDLAQLLKDLPPEAIGSYFDVRHATVEGGEAGWRIGMNLLAPRIIVAAVKDFIWDRSDKGQFKPKDVPVGEGMVPIAEMLRFLAKRRFTGPISLHVEYASKPDIKPGSPDDRYHLENIRKDWTSLKRLLTEAHLG